MFQAGSHYLLTTDDVPRTTVFFEWLFEMKPHFANEMFSEFVLPSQFRIAFFKPVGASAKTFSATGTRGASAMGITVSEIDKLYERIEKEIGKRGGSLSGPPKDHPWGEKSFLLIDPDGNRWELTQSPSPTGMLVNR